MREVIAMSNVKYGTYLVLPLKYDELNTEALDKACPVIEVDTTDVNENIRIMFNGTGDMRVGTARLVAKDTLASHLGGESCRITSDGHTYSFSLMTSYIYHFHTRVAFLCLGLEVESMEALYAICNPGFAANAATYSYTDGSGQPLSFDLGSWLEGFLKPFGLRKFFDGPSSILLEYYCYTLALTDKRFETLEELRRKTFNLHQMVSVDAENEDDSEEDIRYVYAVKNQPECNYRWGICVSSQTINYIVADPSMDLIAEMDTQARDGMPLVALALYEKYTCLRFTELIAESGKKKSAKLRKLKDLMLKFQAFGTVTPANVSRWNNVRQIYAYLQEVCGIENAVEDISRKLNILTEQQRELEQYRSESVMNLITVFGIVSILASVLSIIQILCDGNPAIWIGTILTSGVLAVTFGLALKTRK